MPLELLSTLGLQGALRDLIPAFEAETGTKLQAGYGPTVVQMQRIAEGYGFAPMTREVAAAHAKERIEHGYVNMYAAFRKAQ